MFKNFLMDETGAELAEYAVAVALLVAVALVVYKVLGQGISDANSTSWATSSTVAQSATKNVPCRTRRYGFGGRDSDRCTTTCSTRCPSGETIASAARS